MKIIKITLKLILTLIVFLIIFLIAVGVPQFNFTTNDKFTENDYSFIHEENITGNPKVVDIAVLGAHDAFSNAITKKSEPKPSEKGILTNKVASFIGKGMFVRLAKAQKSGAYDLATHGVRYFDVRTTEYKDSWYTEHGLISDELSLYVSEIIKFLSETNKELIIFDMQHVYYNNEIGMNFSKLWQHMSEIKYEDKNIFDYVYYDPNLIPLANLTYNDVTSLGSGVVILVEQPQTVGCKYYEYVEDGVGTLDNGRVDVIRSNWHKQNDQDIMLEKINTEYNYIMDNIDIYKTMFRKNQAQMTGLYDSFGHFMKTIGGWSLLDMANNFNAKLVEKDEFSLWLEAMPIFMTDYADSMKGNFNDKAIEKINAYNKNLI